VRVSATGPLGPVLASRGRSRRAARAGPRGPFSVPYSRGDLLARAQRRRRGDQDPSTARRDVPRGQCRRAAAVVAAIRGRIKQSLATTPISGPLPPYVFPHCTRINFGRVACVCATACKNTRINTVTNLYADVPRQQGANHWGVAVLVIASFTVSKYGQRRLNMMAGGPLRSPEPTLLVPFTTGIPMTARCSPASAALDRGQR